MATAPAMAYPILSILLSWLNTSAVKQMIPAASKIISPASCAHLWIVPNSARISVNMADVGTKRLPEIIDSLNRRSKQIFDTAKIQYSVHRHFCYLPRRKRFIINGLKESIAWAFGLIALCMLYLFRSFRILVCSLVPNVIPLIITAGVVGWAGVAIKPSTVLVFSVALGIAIDITIRFLVNYKQELQLSKKTSREIVIDTIHKTGISIIYTSLVLIAGFIIFCISDFGGTKGAGLVDFTYTGACNTDQPDILTGSTVDVSKK